MGGAFVIKEMGFLVHESKSRPSLVGLDFLILIIIGIFLYEGFLKDDFWACVETWEISYRVIMIVWRIFGFF